MLTHLAAVSGLAVLCGAWVAVQRWVSRHDPDAPGVEGSCHGCRGGCERHGVCENHPARESRVLEFPDPGRV
jgi:hypothetical protein